LNKIFYVKIKKPFIMKFNFNHFCLGFIFLTLIACSKDEDTSQSVDLASLKGTWNLVSLSCTDGTSTIEILGQKSTSTFVISSKDHQATVSFGQNPNTFVSQGSYTSVITTNTAGVKETQEVPFEDFTSTGTWKLDGNTLIISSPGTDDQKAEITKLDANNLEYKVLVNQTVEELGFQITSKGTYITKLTR